MTTPVQEDDVVQGCWKWLVAGKWCPPMSNDPDNLRGILFEDDLLKDFPALGHYPGMPPYVYYLFQDELYTNLDGTGDNAVVISYAGPWAGSGVLTSWNFQRIAVDFYCDALRSTDSPVMTSPLIRSNPLVGPGIQTGPNTAHRRMIAETRRRLVKIYNRFDKYLHRPQGGDQWWGTLRTVGCVRLGDLNIQPLSDSDIILRGTAYYGVSIG